MSACSSDSGRSSDKTSENPFLSGLQDLFVEPSLVLTEEEIAEALADGFVIALVEKEIMLTDYLGEGGDVVIPDSVTSIGDFAFYECSSLTSVTVGAGSYTESFMKENYPDITLHYN